MLRRLLLLVALWLVMPPSLLAQESQDPMGSEAHADLSRGRNLYVAYCARCHGMTGGGGEGPSLARSELPRAPDHEALVAIVRDGIVGTAMSSTWWLGGEEHEELATYVQSLAPAMAVVDDSVRGDPENGRQLFEGSGGCASCHTVDGFGTNRGPDLTTIGSRRGTPFIRQAIVDPGAALPRGLTEVGLDFVDYLVVRVVDREGREVVGARLNEDSYTIQLRDGLGQLHSFYKPHLQTLEKRFDQSLMQSYREQFSDAEIDDLVAYLTTLRGVG